MNLDTAASYAEILGLITILGAAVYSWFQIREMKASRDSAAALSLSEHLQRPRFVAGIVELSEQPEDLDSMEKFKAHHGENWPDVLCVMTTWESLGALVHRGDLDFYLVYDLYSGLVTFCHEKCEAFITSEREKYGETRLEWFSWLSDRFTQFNATQVVPEPAHIEHAQWVPPKV